MQTVWATNAFVFVTITSVFSFSSCRAPKDLDPRSTTDSATFSGATSAEPTPVPVPTIELAPTPRPTLALHLPVPGPLVDHINPQGSKVKVPLAVVTPKPTLVNTPTIVDSLSKFGVSVDEKRRPILHYRFTEPSVSEQGGAAGLPRE